MSEEEMKEEAVEVVEKEKRRRVMVAIDDSEFSRYALEWTLDNLAGDIAASGRPLVVFTTQNQAALDYWPVYVSAAAAPGAVHSFGALSAASPKLIHSLQEHQKKVSLDLLEKAKAICATKGVAVEAIAEVGDPKQTICEVVDKLKIGLLIMGSHGRGAFQRIFIGSVSNYCVQHAKCPVLVVKKTE